MPPVPWGLDATEARRWHRWVERLTQLGVLSEIHGPALEQLVRAEVRLLRARQALKKHGAYEVSVKSGQTFRSAYSIECDAAEISYRHWIAQFGATPSAATRVGTVGGGAEPPAEQDDESFLAGPRSTKPARRGA